MAKIAFYGSLMRSFEKQKQLKIQHYLEFLSNCTIHGQLYDLGQYPALIHGNHRIQAELYEILDPKVLEVLDAFEGYNAQNIHKSYYVRDCVRLASPNLDAYVYFYRGKIQNKPTVKDGDWLQFHTQKS